ncbi:hypothetical protein KY335_01555 [Candidatus Woesearchaeota archaeon]|nr:hypothetical protein [Candidatus Woesearchaeota archaeon]
MAKKKKLSKNEEFEIMKLVLDKFLWLGFGIMAYGLYRLFQMDWTGGLLLVVVGAIVLILFLIIILKEYEVIRY